MRAEETRTQQPDRDVEARAGDRADGLTGNGRSEIGLKFLYVLREEIGLHIRVASQRVGGPPVGTGRSPEAEVDAPGIQRLERSELLGDHQR